MTPPNPSAGWNKKERLEVIAAISNELIEKSRQGAHVPAPLVFEMAERINLVATKAAFVLEANRREVLHGFLPVKSA